MSRGMSPAGLCWSSTLLVLCGPDEPSWTWTQIWVQARMPDYSLNWIARCCAIQGVKAVNDAAHPAEGGPAETKALTASSLPLIPLPVRHGYQTELTSSQKLIRPPSYRCFYFYCARLLYVV